MQEPVISQSLSYQVWCLNIGWQKKICKDLAKLGLTYGEFVVMSVLVLDIENVPGIKRIGLNQKYVQDLLSLHKKLISNTVLSLVDKGFVYRYKDMFDTRSFIVFPTVKDKSTFSKAYKVVTEFDKMQQATKLGNRGN